MELEFDVEDLLKKNNIESDRIEFKKGSKQICELSL